MRLAISLCVACMLFGGVARADVQPWAVGVSDARMHDAETKLEQGNALFLKREYKEALALYREAIASWDHPAIRFNIVRCLIQLDDPVEAAENLELALKYGAAPLEKPVYTEALSYQKLFASQIGDLEISCAQEGVRVSLDGQVVIERCPGKLARRMKTGTHQLVGEKPGFLTSTERMKVVGGEHDTVELTLVPLAKAAKVEHRWAVWKPWVVFGGGLAVLGAGAGLDFLASRAMSAYDREVSFVCAANACMLNDPRLPSKSAAAHEADAAYAVMGVGAAAAIAGAVMLYVNRGKTVYEKSTIDVSPTEGGVTLSYRGVFR